MEQFFNGLDDVRRLAYNVVSRQVSCAVRASIVGKVWIEIIRVLSEWNPLHPPAIICALSELLALITLMYLSESTESGWWGAGNTSGVVER